MRDEAVVQQKDGQVVLVGESDAFFAFTSQCPNHASDYQVIAILFVLFLFLRLLQHDKKIFFLFGFSFVCPFLPLFTTDFFFFSNRWNNIYVNLPCNTTFLKFSSIHCRLRILCFSAASHKKVKEKCDKFFHINIIEKI